MPGGYFGSYLRIDVSSGAATRVPLGDEVLARFVGGVGLGAWICRAEGGATTEPFAPAAPLVYCFSPLVGTPLTTSAKFAIVARSPLTGFCCDAISSSHFAIAGKRTGFDAIVLVGQAARLTRVVIDGERVTLEDATALAGRPATACERPGFRTSAIGLRFTDSRGYRPRPTPTSSLPPER